MILCVSAHTHIRYTHTRAVVDSQAIAMQPNDILLELAQIREHFYSKQGLSLRPRIYRAESGKTADGRFQIRLIQTAIGEQTDYYSESHSRPCRVYVCALAFDILRRGAHTYCAAHTRKYGSHVAVFICWATQLCLIMPPRLLLLLK